MKIPGRKDRDEGGRTGRPEHETLAQVPASAEKRWVHRSRSGGRSQLSFRAGTRTLLGRGDWRGLVGMRPECLAMRVGVRRVFFGEGRFFDRFVRGMGQRVIGRVVPRIFKVTRPVHTGALLHRRFTGRFFARVCIAW